MKGCESQVKESAVYSADDEKSLPMDTEGPLSSAYAGNAESRFNIQGPKWGELVLLN